MGKWSNLTDAVAAVIRANGNREITGQVLQNALLNIISNLGNFASFAGMATPSTNPGTPDGPVYYFATHAGTYTNFGALVLDGSCYVLYWNGTAWSSTKIDLPTTAEVTSVMNSLIATESTARQQADATLQSAISAEATRAKAKEDEIANPVVKELYLVGADSSLQYEVRARLLDGTYSIYVRPVGTYTNVCSAFISSANISNVVALAQEGSSGVYGYINYSYERVTSEFKTYPFNGNFSDLSFSPVIAKKIDNLIADAVDMTPASTANGMINVNTGEIITNSDYTVNSYTVQEGDAILFRTAIPKLDTNLRAFLAAYDTDGNFIKVLYTNAKKELSAYFTVESGIATIKMYYKNALSTKCFFKKLSAGVYWDIAADVKELRRTATDVKKLKESFFEMRSYNSSDGIEGYYNIGNATTFNGQFIAQSGQNLWWGLPMFTLEAGEKFTVWTVGGGNARAWCVCDMQNNVIDKAEANVNTLSNPYTYTATEKVKVYITKKSDAGNLFSVIVEKIALNIRVTNLEASNTALSDAVKSTVPSFSNTYIDFAGKPQLKVLDIGNSFTEDPVAYLQEWITANDIDVSDMCLYKLIRGSGSFKTFYDSWHNQDGTDGCKYYHTKQVGGLNQTVTGSTNLERMHSIIEDCKWDVIIVHQVSDYSDYTLAEWESNANSGYLKEALRIIRAYQPQAMIACLFPHIPYKTTSTTAERFAKSKKVYREFCSKYGIDFVIPVATAIENLRASSLNASPVEYAFSRDKHHLGYGLARYVASATYFQSLFGKRYGTSVYGSSCRHALTQDEVSDYPNENIAVDNTNAGIAQMCALIACNDMWEIVNPDGISL